MVFNFSQQYANASWPVLHGFQPCPSHPPWECSDILQSLLSPALPWLPTCLLFFSTKPRLLIHRLYSNHQMRVPSTFCFQHWFLQHQNQSFTNVLLLKGEISQIFQPKTNSLFLLRDCVLYPISHLYTASLSLMDPYCSSLNMLKFKYYLF